MTRDELLAFFTEKTSAARDLMSKKNQDYAEVDEVFGNLNVCETLNIAPAESGILIRMTDKLRRLISLTKREAAVKDESFEDTCLDLINYTILLMARRAARRSIVEAPIPQPAVERQRRFGYCNYCDGPSPEPMCLRCRTFRRPMPNQPLEFGGQSRP